jgi:hypothetical protein
VTTRPEGPAYAQAVWSWAEHLRGGGSTPWSTWVASGAGADATVPPTWSAPGAAQLELVRRLAGLAPARGVDPAAFRALADVVVARSGPGRGLAQQPLSFPAGGAPGRRFGAPPTDPSDVPPAELVRVAVGTLTQLLLEGPAAPAERTELRRRRFSRSPAFALAGAPVTTSAVRRALGVAGHAEGGRHPRVVLVAEPLDETLAQVWSGRVQRGAPVRWGGFVERWSRRRTLPPSADFVRLARQWAREVGRERVHVVVAPADPSGTVADLLGVRLGRERHPELRPRWKNLSPAAVDVARRVNAVLNVRAAGPRRAEAVRACASLLAAVDTPAPRLALPERFGEWATARATRLADDLRADGYPVHGDLVRVVPRFESLPTAPRHDDVLRVVVDACLRRAASTSS